LGSRSESTVPTSNRAIVFRSEIDQATRYTREWGGKVRDKLKTEGVETFDYEDADANPVNFVDSLKNHDPLAVFLFDHGSECDVYGEQQNQLAPLLSMYNADLTKDRVVAVVACSSAKLLGPRCVREGCVAYHGYDEPFGFYTWTTYYNAFKECAIEVFIKLAEGQSFRQGHNSSQAKMRHYMQEWLRRPPDNRAPYAIAAMRSNKKCQKLLGNANATIK